MTDIKTVLTIDKIMRLAYESSKRLDHCTEGDIIEFARAIEAAVLAASAPSQEPSNELIASSVIGWDISVDVSTDEKDAGNRIFAKIEDWQHDSNGGIVLLANDPDFNFDHASPVDVQDTVAYLVDGNIEQGLFFDKTAAETMAFMNCGVVKPLGVI
jgi:hypothetical protein